jgi:hypothetical protein
VAGYSATPLVQKLGIKAGAAAYVKSSPVPYRRLLGTLPTGVKLKRQLIGPLDFVHVFTRSRKELASLLVRARAAIQPNGMIWVSWPKKTAKVPTDVTEDVIREVALPLNLVDIKVCAVDEIWSGLKLVIRKSER